MLVVEDEQFIRILVTALFSEECNLSTAADAAQALELLDRERFDLVLSDHDLGGGMTGDALLDEIEARWPETRRYLMSASPRSTTHEFLSKPFDLDVLKRLLGG